MTDAPNENMSIWSAVERTDPAHTKRFQRAGGFSGTAINATYNARRATELFGPCGIGWGYDVVSDRLDSHPESGEQVLTVLVRLWYHWDTAKGQIIHAGATTLSGRRSGNDKPYIDEEAYKKSITDGLSKCFSMLGFSADIHQGLYDDNKYVEELRKDSNGKKAAEKPTTPDPLEDAEAFVALAREKWLARDGATEESWREAQDFIRLKMVVPDLHDVPVEKRAAVIKKIASGALSKAIAEAKPKEEKANV